MDFKVFNAHLDLTYDLIKKSSLKNESLLDREYFYEFDKGNVSAVVAAIYLDDDELGEDAFQNASKHIEVLEREVSLSEKYKICLSASELEFCSKNEKIGLFISLEGLEPIGDNLKLIDEFYSKGVRLMGLTWSRDNLVAYGSHFQDLASEEKGLTDFGFEVMKYIEKLPIILDVSHLNEGGFWDVVENYGKPFIASHSNCRFINNITRNLTDRQIRAIADSGGVVGINGSNIIVSETDDAATVSSYVDHIEHIIEIAGIDHVGFGFDFCDKIMQYVPKDFLNSMSRVPKDIIENHSEIPLIINELSIRGYSQRDIDKITYNNFFRLINAVID